MGLLSFYSITWNVISLADAPIIDFYIVDIIVIESAVLPYNKGAPSFDDYANTLIGLGFVPVGVDEIHLSNNMLVQIDVVYLKQHSKEQYYGNNKFFTTIMR